MNGPAWGGVEMSAPVSLGVKEDEIRQRMSEAERTLATKQQEWAKNEVTLKTQKAIVQAVETLKDQKMYGINMDSIIVYVDATPEAKAQILRRWHKIVSELEGLVEQNKVEVQHCADEIATYQNQLAFPE